MTVRCTDMRWGDEYRGPRAGQVRRLESIRRVLRT